MSTLKPLLVKARRVMTHYHQAMDCFVNVLDKSGKVTIRKDYKRQIRFCEFCRKHTQNPALTYREDKEPCEKLHYAAIAESRLSCKTYIYVCPAGFAYWTSPLYNNGRYVGSLTAGQVLLYTREEAAEKMRAFSTDLFALEKLDKMLEEKPEKSNAEIQAMARLLGICAEEISGKREASLGKIRCVTWFEEKPLEKERMLLAAFRRGDNETGYKIIGELIQSIHAANPDNLEVTRVRALELTVLLSRAAMGSEAQHSDAVLKVNNRNYKRIQESKTEEELIENMRLAAGQMSGKIFSLRGIRHAAALRRAQRYIWANFTRKISLEEISRFSGLSAPYFSSIFKEELGENLSSYLNRLRVEKAAALLTETGSPLNVIAGLCGFEDQSWFSRIFKNFTGVSPGKYRGTGCPVQKFYI